MAKKPSTHSRLSLVPKARAEQLERRNRAISIGMCRSTMTRAVVSHYGSLSVLADLTGYSVSSLSAFLRGKGTTPPSVMATLRGDMPAHDFSKLEK